MVSCDEWKVVKREKKDEKYKGECFICAANDINLNSMRMKEIS